MKPVVVDFETLGIEDRPDYPPPPVGVAITFPGKKPHYWAFGHINGGNNCSWADAATAIKRAWDHKGGLVFQNGKFDIDVAEVHFGVPRLHWSAYHDTMYLLFLDDPHQLQLGLKPSAERYLGLAPDERDEVRDWLMTRQPVRNVRIGRGNYGAYIAYAPGDLVGKYAVGDVERTRALFELLRPKVCETRGMAAAYDRERELNIRLLDIERRGVRVRHQLLADSVATYTTWFERLEDWVLKQLKQPEVNLDSGAQLAEALIKAKKADADAFGITTTGKLQTNKEALDRAISDPVLYGVLKYRAQLKTCLGTFMKPWLATANASGGLIYTTWHQTKAPSGDESVGTRTGRLSSTPNFQNIPKEFSPIFAHELAAGAKLKLPKSPFKDLPPLPQVRSFIGPADIKHILLDRDYSQQEPRILAHFDGGALMQKYLADPWVDFHDYAKAELEKMGLFYDRKPVKNTNLGLIYGMGVGKLAEKNGMTVDESSQLKKAILQLYPGLKEMYRDMKLRAQTNQPIRTWGGREYYCEPPKLVDGRIREFDYKMVNLLIQGSAADCTKAALLTWLDLRDLDPERQADQLIVTVHDEILISAPAKDTKPAMALLKQAMESVKFDVPILSEGSTSTVSWADLKDYDKKGKVLSAN